MNGLLRLTIIRSFRHLHDTRALTFSSIWAEKLLHPSSWFPKKPEPEDFAKPGFCLGLVLFILCTWFPLRLESEDHASLRFCPRPGVMIFPFIRHFPRRWTECPWALTQCGPGPRIWLVRELRDISATSGHAVLSDAPRIEVRLYEAPWISWLQLTLEVEPRPLCL